MTITRKLFLTLLIAWLAVLAVGAYGVWQLARAEARFQAVTGDVMPAMATLDQARAALWTMRLGVRDVLLADNASDKARAETRTLAAYGDFDAAMQTFRQQHAADARNRQLLEEEKNAMQTFRAANDRTMALGKLDARQGLASMRQAPQATAALYKALETHFRYNAAVAAQLSAQNQAEYASARTLAWLCIAAALLLTGGLSVQLFRTIHTGLAQMRADLGRVSETLDFTARARADRSDEIAAANLALNTLLEKLQTSFLTLHAVARDVDRASGQLQDTAQQVAGAATTQSEASAAMAATIEEMTVSVNHVAEQARTTQDGANASQQLVESGAHTIHQTIEDIHHISTMVKDALGRIQLLESDSNQVAAVINVIREIADQINLLALNASIEAARAGEYGRGFAVVADEVRKLAERTTRSTQEISATIAAMLERASSTTAQMLSVESMVETSVGRADAATQAINRIGEHAGKAATSIGAIAAAIRQQGEACQMIAQQVDGTAETAESTRAAARQTAESVTQLGRLVQHQMDTLALFKC